MNGILDVEPKQFEETNATTLQLGYYVYFSSEEKGETVLHQVLEHMLHFLDIQNADGTEIWWWIIYSKSIWLANRIPVSLPLSTTKVIGITAK